MRATVIMDYQNVHLTARDMFCPGHPAHEALIHPMQFARVAVRRRNERTRDGTVAELAKVLVFRGLPHVEHDTAQNARCLEQQTQWRIDGAEVHLRDLKYKFQRGADGRPLTDIHGKKIPQGAGKEKGIDVLCALASVREALDPQIGVVMLASRDTDLVPALDEVYDMHGQHPDRVAKVETLTWDDAGAPRRFGSLRPTPPRRIWNTNLDRSVFNASLDRRSYL